MKSFLKSKKGILGLVALLAIIIILTFVAVKCSKGPKDKEKDIDRIKIEEENNTEDGLDWSDVGFEPEDTSNAGLKHKGGDVGQSNKEDVTEFPNDVDGDEVLGTEGDNPTDTGNTDEPEDFKGGTLY